MNNLNVNKNHFNTDISPRCSIEYFKEYSSCKSNKELLNKHKNDINKKQIFLNKCILNINNKINIYNNSIYIKEKHEHNLLDVSSNILLNTIKNKDPKSAINNIVDKNNEYISTNTSIGNDINKISTSKTIYENEMNCTISENNISKNNMFISAEFKIVLLGDFGCGKSSYFNSLKNTKTINNVHDINNVTNNNNNNYNNKNKNLLSKNVIEKIMLIDECILLTLNIWDTNGDEKYNTITKQYLINTDGILLCFDITNKDSFLSIEKYINYIKTTCYKSNIIITLIGIKSDLDKERAVCYNEIESLTKLYNLDFIEISNNKNKNIELSLEFIARSLIKINETSIMDKCYINNSKYCFQNQFTDIHNSIMSKLNDSESCISYSFLNKDNYTNSIYNNSKSINNNYNKNNSSFKTFVLDSSKHSYSLIESRIFNNKSTIKNQRIKNKNYCC